MKQALICLFMIILFLSIISVAPSSSSQNSKLLDKLVSKGILTQEEADEILAEEKKEQTQQAGKESGMEMPGWIKKIKLSGDLRLRHDTQWREERKISAVTDTEYHRNRERYRLRLGLKAKTSETTDVGVRLASGSGCQNTTNQSFDDHSRGGDIFIDRAFASWKPCKYFKLIAGKHKNTLFTSSLAWDSDVNPEGMTQNMSYKITDSIDLFANTGQWYIEELDLKAVSDTDPTILVYQGGLAIKPADGVKIQLGVSYYDFNHFENLYWDADLLDDKSSFAGFNDNHSQQMIFTEDPRGDQGGEYMLANKFECTEFNAKITVKDVLPVPLSIFGSYIKNSSSDVKRLIEKGADTGDSDPMDLLYYTGYDMDSGDPVDLDELSYDDRDAGWQAGFSVGNKKKKGDWYMKYFYQRLEDYAFPAVFVDSDFHGGGTNNKGHFLQGSYMLRDKIQAKVSGFTTEREDERKDGKKDEDRIQVDAIFGF